MSSKEIGGVSIIGIRDALSRLNAAVLGLRRAKEAQHKDAFLTVAYLLPFWGILYEAQS
jgi:hypothetical protein